MSNDPGEKLTGQIQQLIGDLESKKGDQQQKAVDALKSMGKAAVPALVEALVNPSVKVRFAAGQILADSRADWKGLANPRIIQSLVSDLICPDGFNRLVARRSLAYIGNAAVPDLTQALKSQANLARWEAAKALSQIGDASATQALITAITDKVFDVRWLAAEGLISIGRPALVPLLKEVIKNPESIWLREAAHHILHELNNERVSAVINPILRALQDSDATLQTPLLAQRALNVLETR
jgi:HEAT repeat protein